MPPFKLNFQNISKPLPPKVQKKLYVKLCSICGEIFRSKNQFVRECGARCRKRKSREKLNPERAAARKRCKGKCEECRKTSTTRLFFRSKRMLCGRCNSLYSQKLFRERAGDLKSSRTKLWDRVQNSLDEIPPKTGGIYSILCKSNQREFVGSARSVFKICKKHVEDLQSGNHSITLLQSDWSELGRDQFEFRLLKEVVDFSLLDNELNKNIAQRQPAYNVS